MIHLYVGRKLALKLQIIIYYLIAIVTSSGFIIFNFIVGIDKPVVKKQFSHQIVFINQYPPIV